MVSLVFLFWFFVILFGIIGMMRGWVKELMVVFSVVLSLAFVKLLERYVPFVIALEDAGQALFWLRAIILIVLVFFGYQTVSFPRFAAKANREKLQDSLLGFVLGAANGYLVMGSLWYYLAMANYPFTYITAPNETTELGKAAAAMIASMPPRLLGEPAIYFAVVLAFIFILVVFI